MPPLAIPFKLRAKLYKQKPFGSGVFNESNCVWIAECTQRAPGLPNHWHSLVMDVRTRAEAAAIARAEFAKRDIKVTIR